MNNFDVFYESNGICTDSRADVSGSLFICIKGENFDGNTFATEALKNGAHHVILDNPEYLTDEDHMTLVPDSIQYLQQLANYHRRKFDIPVIGITGSNGKTTTKELINAVLSKKYKVLATKGNLNNHLGVPFTLLGITDEHEIAIIEMGANRFKDIEELCAIAEPNYGIITNIGKAHLEGFKTFEGVLATKKELYEAVDNVNGTIIVNMDDSVLMSNLPSNCTFITYGKHDGADIEGELLHLSPYVEMSWKHQQYISDVVSTKMIGEYNFYNFLSAVAFGITFDVNPEDINKAISNYEPENRRSQVKESESNTLILDCYNANPTSMSSALLSFEQNETPKEKLLILGEMKELGNETRSEHEAVIELAESLGLSGYFVGKAFSGFNSSVIKQYFETTAELLDHLKQIPVHDKLILLKGSRSVGLEKCEEYL